MACARVDDRFQRIKACAVDALYADGMDRAVGNARLRENYYPKAESGEATFVSPAINAKVGSKLF